MKRIVFGLGVVLLVALCVPAYSAPDPMDTVKSYISEGMEIVGNKSLGRDTKIKKIEALYEKMVDEEELARRSLGRYWKNLTPAQQKEFIPLFRRVLENAYIDKILSYNNEKIVFSKQSRTSGNMAEVNSKVITASKEIPITYRVIMKNGDWKVYDFVIENISLVQNYRSQFNAILAKETPAQLIETLKKKISRKQA
jgi:phospholipid transport system substrate-binding protein